MEIFKNGDYWNGRFSKKEIFVNWYFQEGGFLLINIFIEPFKLIPLSIPFATTKPDENKNRENQKVISQKLAFSAS